MTMTERALPAVSIGIAARPRLEVAPGERAATRPVVARKEALFGTSSRAGMLFGASAAIYAVTLAGIAGLQGQSDAAVAAERVPYLGAVREARAANDVLEATIVATDTEVRALIANYDAVTGDVTAYQTQLDSLAALVSEVEGSAAALPARIKLPTVSMAGSVARSSRGTTSSAPKTTAKTGASGR